MISELMRTHGENVFPRQRLLAATPGIFRAGFRARPLRDLLREALKDRRLGDLDAPS